MADSVPVSREGRMAFQEELIAGDAKAAADSRPTFTNPTSAEMQTELDAQRADIVLLNDLDGQISAVKDRIHRRDEQMEAVQRKKVRFVKGIYPDDSNMWKPYGIGDTVSHGKKPQDPIAIRILSETATSVTIAIDGGEGADRFELRRREEGWPAGEAVVVATDIRASEREYSDAGLESGKRYLYTATAHNAFGQAGPSNDLLVTP